MENVLDIYKKPYDEDFPVVCMDESPKQLIEEGKPALPLKPGRDERVDYEYVRHGVVNIFMANEPLKGRRLASKDQKEFLSELKPVYKAATKELSELNLTKPGEKWRKKHPVVIRSWEEN